jgi:hypothetical protein
LECEFPPPLEIGSRVWTVGGYHDHGPLEGPKINITPNMGGTITATESPYYTMDSLLYAVHWDNGQISKHYTKGLFCIGRFQTRTEFEAAININGTVELTLGPQGGYRHARVCLRYDGHPQEVEIDDRVLWIDCLERLARKNGVQIHTIILPPKSRKKS